MASAERWTCQNDDERCRTEQMFGNSFPLFSVRGIDVRADLSWLFIVALVSWSFYSRFIIWYEREAGPALIMAIAAAVLFFGSVVVHELAHALEAQRRGVHVAGITLFVFGGATHSKFDVKRPGDEFALTAIGPYSSLVLAAAFGLAALGADEAGLDATGEVLGNLGWLNLALAIFNLLPGAPLDGGRILRAAVWKATGDRRRAIVVASNAGRILGGLIIVLGVVQLLTVTGIGGLWFILIGWFLYRAATAERTQAEVKDLVSDRRAGDLMTEAEPIPASSTVEEAIDRWFVPHEADMFLVRDDGRIVGVIDVRTVMGTDRSERPSTVVGDLARHVEDMRTVDADAPAEVVVDTILEEGEPVLVTRGSQPAGVVSPERLQRTLSRMHGLQGGGRRPGRRASSDRGDLPPPPDLQPRRDLPPSRRSPGDRPMDSEFRP